MGNQVGVSREPPQLAELFPLQNEAYIQSNGDHHGAGEDGFRSYIQMWRFYSEGGDDMYIKNSPVKLGTFKKFDSRDCYIALHIFKNYGDSKHSSINSHEVTTNNCNTPYSLHELVNSSIEELTPRGISSSFGTLTLEPFIHTSREEYTHDLYVWNGKSATPLAKAVALAKGFEIERVLVKEKIIGTVYRRFARGPKSSLSSIFKDDIDEGKHLSDNKRYDVNHLFRQLLCPYKRSTSIKIGELFGNHLQGDPSRFEVLKKTLHQKFDPGSSSPSPSSIRRQIPKIPLSHHQSPQQSPDQTPRPKVPPIFVKAATEPSLSPYKKRATPALSFENLSQQPIAIDEYNENDYSTWDPRMVLDVFEPLLSQILEFLFLSSRIPTANKPLLKSRGVTHILNCAGSVCANHFPDDFVYKTYFITDSSGEDITCLFYETIDFIEEARQKGGKVLIHCHQGVSRSSSFVILYLMWQFKWEFTKAHEWVRAIRYISNPNPGFTGQLILWFNNLQKLPTRPRLNALPPPTTPPQPPVVINQARDNQWLPLSTPRNSSPQYEPISTPRGPRTTDPSPTPRSSSPSRSPPPTPRGANPSHPTNSNPASRSHSVPSIPSVTMPPISMATQPNTTRNPPTMPSISTNNLSFHFNLSTPGEPPPITRSSTPDPAASSIPTLFMHQPKTLVRTASDPTPSSTPPGSPPPTKLYRLVSHSQNTIVVTKLVVEPLTARSLDPRGIFSLCVPGTVYLWYGSRASPQLVENARRLVERLQRYECASTYVEDIRQCHEPPAFWSYFQGGAAEVVENQAYNREYAITTSQSPGRREQLAAAQVQESAELYRYQENGSCWEKLGGFDLEDLEEEEILILSTYQPTKHMWVWVGPEYAGKWGMDVDAVDGNLVARQFKNDYKMLDDCGVTIIKNIDEESDEFLSHFH